MKKPFITIFTPTFNREDKLKRLYKSLCSQSCKEFMWLVVDDGSTDHTEQEILQWKEKADFFIVYYKQENRGKSMAHNVGVEKSNTELFSCVDSDDYLADNAIEEIKKIWCSAGKEDIGILALRQASIVNEHIGNQVIHTTLRNAYQKRYLIGDTMLIYRTELMKKYEFPYFEGEKFVPENYLYDQLDQEGTLIFLNEVLYCGDYLDDGYTANMAKVLKKNPYGYLAYIKQRIGYDTKLRELLPDLIRYIAMAHVVKLDGVLTSSMHPVWTLLLFPLGTFFYLKRYKDILI